MRHLRHINRIVSVLSVQRERQEILFKTHIHCTWNAVGCCQVFFRSLNQIFFFSYLILYRVAHLVCTSVFPPASRCILFIWPEDFGVGWRRTNKTLLFVFSQCFTSLTSFMIIDDWNDWVCIWRCQQCFYECLACFWLYGELFWWYTEWPLWTKQQGISKGIQYI